MTWFKYLKSSEITNSSIENTNYKYPYLKRAIKNFKPLDTILSGTWAFISVQDLEINKLLVLMGTKLNQNKLIQNHPVLRFVHLFLLRNRLLLMIYQE
jgi:hypothetical protein